MIGIAGSELAPQERAWIAHAAVAGVILFTRNFENLDQLRALCADIRAVRADTVIAVDQEGGRVQRFKNGFTSLPPLAAIGALYDARPAAARRAARLHATIMATEVLGAGLDLSFAPVADLQRGNLAIGDRAFHADPAVCAELVTVYVDAMQRAGMAATLKHFPGHGSVLADTHFDRAIDMRPALQIMEQDVLPFAMAGALAKAVMMGHVEYPSVAPEAAGYSSFWIKTALKQALAFDGVVISDDIGMQAGAALGAIAERLSAHRRAGCDLVLVCSPDIVEPALCAAQGFRATDKLARALRGRLRAPLEKELSRSTWSHWNARLQALLDDARPS